MTGVVFGLGAAVLWGVADFLVRFASRGVGAFRALFYSQLAGLAALSLVVLAWPAPSIDLIQGGLMLGLGALGMAGALALYRAFAIGTLAIVSPIAASGNAIAVLIALLTGERPTALRLAGIAVTTAGVLLASTDIHQLRARTPAGPGVGLALLAAGCFGVALWGMGRLVVDLGAMWLVWGLRLVSVLVLVAAGTLLRRSLRPPPAAAWPWILPVGVLDAGANLSYSLGLAGAFIAVVAVLSSLFSAVTVLLAWLFLRERLAANQWLGVLLILGGVALVSLPSA